MRILVTGSAGHLGEALVRTLREDGHPVIGLDRLDSPFTDRVGSIADRERVAGCMEGVAAVFHTATLHKPHVATHSHQDFVDTNVTGTLHLLEESVKAGVGAFVFTSTTSAFGGALTPPPGAPAAWIDEDVRPIPRNIYGVTKVAAEDLCELFHRLHHLPCVVLRTSRFFPEPDDDPVTRESYADANVKANELLHRRVDLADVVAAHRRALERAPALGFARYIISAPTPFTPEDLPELRRDAPAVVRRRFPGYEEPYRQRSWMMFPSIDRVYDSSRARRDLDWTPRHDFAHMLSALCEDRDPRSGLARTIGSKGYHPTRFAGGHRPTGKP